MHDVCKYIQLTIYIYVVQTVTSAYIATFIALTINGYIVYH